MEEAILHRIGIVELSVAAEIFAWDQGGRVIPEEAARRGDEARREVVGVIQHHAQVLAWADRCLPEEREVFLGLDASAYPEGGRAVGVYKAENRACIDQSVGCPAWEH